VVFVDERLLALSTEVCLKYDGTLSLADAASVAVMCERGIKEIVSLDADFISRIR